MFHWMNHSFCVYIQSIPSNQLFVYTDFILHSSCRGFLDGDGMLVSIVLRPPEERADYCTFSSAWVRTAGIHCNNHTV